MKAKILCTGCLLAALFCVSTAHAAVVMTLEQVGPDVVATGSGTVDTTGLSGIINRGASSAIAPFRGILIEGNGDNPDTYIEITGPSNFGSGINVLASSGTGDPLGIDGTDRVILVPHLYASGTPLSSTATWDNTTLATLGVTPGTYTWTWGTGTNADSLTLYAGVPAPSSVPEPAPAFLLALGAAALALRKRIKK